MQPGGAMHHSLEVYQCKNGSAPSLLSIVVFGLWVVSFFAASGPALAQTAPETPSNLRIVGTIDTGESDVTLAVNDQVVVFTTADGRTVATGTVLDASRGSFFVEMSQPMGFNGTDISLRLRTSAGVFQLLFGPDNKIAFSGGFPFPNSVTLRTTIGPRVGGNDDPGDRETATVDEAPPGDIQVEPTGCLDVTGDGVVDQRDIDFVVEQLRRSRPDSQADANCDGVVSSLDVVVLIRALFSTQARGSVVQFTDLSAAPGDAGGETTVSEE